VEGPNRSDTSAPSTVGAGWCLGAAASIVAGAVLCGVAPTDAAIHPRATVGLPAARYADGAPAGFSGGFGEQSCHACHFEHELNVAPGRVTIDGIPGRFRAGARYPLTVTVTRPGLAAAGFQLTARIEDGGAQGGSLAPSEGEDARVAVAVQGGIQYASQRHAGTAPVAPDAARWTLTWTAPETDSKVVFHVAANAADADGSADGDYVYTAALETRAEP
jgi:hypothetical protein